MPPPSRLRLPRALAHLPWRRVAVLAGISLALALALVLFLFDWSDHLVGRLFTAFFVVFWLLAVTFLGAVPFVGWATGHWFGRGWQEAGTGGRRSPAQTPPPRPTPPPVAPAPRRPSHR